MNPGLYLDFTPDFQNVLNSYNCIVLFQQTFNVAFYKGASEFNTSNSSVSDNQIQQCTMGTWLVTSGRRNYFVLMRGIMEFIYL